MTFEEFQAYVNAFPGEYRESFAIERARIYQRLETAEDMEQPYNQLQHLLVIVSRQLGLKDSLSQALVLELAHHSANLEQWDAAVWYTAFDHVVQFRKMNAQRTVPVNYWAGGESLIRIDKDVLAMYMKRGTELEQLISESWEPKAK